MKRANPAVIGGFIVGALILGVAAVFVFGSGTLFKDKFRCVMYFQGAVQGLQVGAPVNFRGVKIGTVKAVKMAFDRKSLEIRIPVFVEFPRAQQGEMEMMQMLNSGSSTPQEALDTLIKRGLRAQLQVESLVTGQLFVQLDIYPDIPSQDATTDPVTQLLEIPTVPTTLQEISQTFRQALNKLADLKLEEMIHDLQNTLQGVERLVNSPELMELIHNMNVGLQDAQQFLRNADKQLEHVATSATTTLGNFGKLAADIQPLVRNMDTLARDADALLRNTDKQVERLAIGATAALGSFGKLAQQANTQVQSLGSSLSNTSTATLNTLEQARDTLATLQKIVAPNAPVGYELAKTLRELSETARSLRMLADYLERNPSSLLFGRQEGRSK